MTRTAGRSSSRAHAFFPALERVAPAPPVLTTTDAVIRQREEFAGETVLTVMLPGRNLPLAALTLDVSDPLFYPSGQGLRPRSPGRHLHRTRDRHRRPLSGRPRRHRDAGPARRARGIPLGRPRGVHSCRRPRLPAARGRARAGEAPSGQPAVRRRRGRHLHDPHRQSATRARRATTSRPSPTSCGGPRPSCARPARGRKHPAIIRPNRWRSRRCRRSPSPERRSTRATGPSAAPCASSTPACRNSSWTRPRWPAPGTILRISGWCTPAIKFPIYSSDRRFPRSLTLAGRDRARQGPAERQPLAGETSARGLALETASR